MEPSKASQPFAGTRSPPEYNLRPLPPTPALGPTSTPLPPTYVPSHVLNLGNVSSISPSPNPTPLRRTSFSAGDTRSFAKPTSSLFYNDLLDDIRRREDASRIQPPKYTPTDPFLDPTPSPYSSFWQSMQSKTAPAEPKSYAQFFEKKRTPGLPTSTPSSPAIFSAPNSDTTTSTPLTNPLRSFGANTNKVFPSFGFFTPSDDVTMGFYPYTPSSPNKRKKAVEPDSPSKQEAKRRKIVYRSLTTSEKLDKIFDLVDELGWTLGDFMLHVFAHRDVHRSRRHSNIVQRYLSGQNDRHISEVLELWMSSPDGAGYEQDAFMYSTTTPYTEIGNVRAALTSFAAQVVKVKLVKDVKAAVRVSGGMHAPTENNLSPEHNTGRFAELATSLMHNMKTMIMSNQPLLYDYVVALATPDPINRNGVVVQRRNRPPELTAVSTIAMIAFCRNYHARIYPLVRGIVYLASHVPVDIISLNSHLGGMPSINTIKSALKGFSRQKAARIRLMGRDTATVELNGTLMVKATIIIMDNSQHFRRQRERRIGRENAMVIGISATYIQKFVASTALDPLDKQYRISLNLRHTMNVEDILSRINFPHLRQIGKLQFIEAIAKYIPEATIYTPEILIRYRTRCKKRLLPPEVTDINPLACSGKNEALIPELKDAMLDFIEQTGQTAGSFDNRLWFAGGDGMSYNNLLLVQKYMRNHSESPFQSFKLMRPVLQTWHTMWTDLCRIHETHWGAALNDNPASLGNSAKKIGRPAPANLKKVDYYPAADLLALVHDMRMLDCWRIYFKCEDLHEYFAAQAAANTLLSFEDMEVAAEHLYDTYVSTIAQQEAAEDARDGSSSWASQLTPGTPWIPLPIDATSASAPKRKRKRKAKPVDPAAKPKPPALVPSKLPFFGDQVISDEAGFMRDASISREVAAAVAVGDVGRMWEGMKVMLFNFTGSGHSKYSGYLLEMFVDLELESSPELRDAQLDSMICNPSGRSGGHQPCDIFQERMNRELEPIVQRKDTDYGSDHVRNLWSRNIKDIYDIKAEIRVSAGLARHSGRHKHPHSKPEVKILLHHYKDTELHQRRAGRTYRQGDAVDVDNFSAGLKKLTDGGLAKFVRRSTTERNLVERADEQDDSSDESDSDDGEEPAMTLGLVHAFGGEVMVDVEDGNDGTTGVDAE